jgi:hypothetical protein
MKNSDLILKNKTRELDLLPAPRRGEVCHSLSFLKQTLDFEYNSITEWTVIS